MGKKWIICNGRIRMGNVDFHRQLSSDHTQTIGGGLWHIDDEVKKIYFYSSSHDFGQCNYENFKAAFYASRFSMRINKYMAVFSRQESLEEAIMRGSNVGIINS